MRKGVAAGPAGDVIRRPGARPDKRTWLGRLSRPYPVTGRDTAKGPGIEARGTCYSGKRRRCQRGWL